MFISEITEHISIKLCIVIYSKYRQTNLYNFESYQCNEIITLREVGTEC